jgi:hypothetical protein
MIDEHDAIMMIFSGPQVRHRKTAHFLETFGPDALPDGPELAAMMGKFQFLVEDWDDDRRELYSIPEVRKCYQHFHRVWPYWFFFCDLRTETLTMMMERAGMSEMDIYNRTRDVFHHFKLPYTSEPPEV